VLYEPNLLSLLERFQERFVGCVVLHLPDDRVFLPARIRAKKACSDRLLEHSHEEPAPHGGLLRRLQAAGLTQTTF
jgi:hypothetical protein